MNFTHYTVNRSQDSVYPVKGAHTKRLVFVGLAKRYNCKECGRSRDLLDSYLLKFIWQKRYEGTDLFQQIIKH